MYRYSARVSYPLINTSGWRSRESANQLDPAAAEPEALTTPWSTRYCAVSHRRMEGAVGVHVRVPNKNVNYENGGAPAEPSKRMMNGVRTGVACLRVLGQREGAWLRGQVKPKGMRRSACIPPEDEEFACSMSMCMPGR